MNINKTNKDMEELNVMQKQSISSCINTLTWLNMTSFTKSLRLVPQLNKTDTLHFKKH